MAKDINLLPKVVEAEIKRGEYRRFGSILSLSLIGLVVVLVAGLFIWSFVIDRSLRSVEQNIASREEGIQDNLDKELKLRAVHSKVKLINPLIDPSFAYSDIVSQLQQIAQASPSVETSELTLEGLNLTYSGRSPSSLALQDYLDALLDPQIGGQYFHKVFLTALSRNETLTEYRFSLKMTYTPSKEVNASR